MIILYVSNTCEPLTILPSVCDLKFYLTIVFSYCYCFFLCINQVRQSVWRLNWHLVPLVPVVENAWHIYPFSACASASMNVAGRSYCFSPLVYVVMFLVILHLSLFNVFRFCLSSISHGYVCKIISAFFLSIYIPAFWDSIDSNLSKSMTLKFGTIFTYFGLLHYKCNCAAGSSYTIQLTLAI